MIQNQSVIPGSVWTGIYEMCTGVSFMNTPLCNSRILIFSIFPQGYTLKIMPWDGTVSLTVTVRECVGVHLRYPVWQVLGWPLKPLKNISI